MGRGLLLLVFYSFVLLPGHGVLVPVALILSGPFLTNLEPDAAIICGWLGIALVLTSCIFRNPRFHSLVMAAALLALAISIMTFVTRFWGFGPTLWTAIAFGAMVIFAVYRLIKLNRRTQMS